MQTNLGRRVFWVIDGTSHILSICFPSYHCSHRAPLGLPLAIPLPLGALRFPRVFAAPLLAPLETSPTPPRLPTPELGRAAGAGVVNLVGMRDEGGLSINDVSVVRKVSSAKSGLDIFCSTAECPCSSFCRALLKESGIGAYAIYSAQIHQLNTSTRQSGWITSGKSTQKAFMFMPYKKLAKLSLNLLKLSCINCRCMKLASRSAIESESSANAGSRDSRGKAEAEDAPGVKVWLSRREVREEGRSGVEGREGGLFWERVAEVERIGFGRSILNRSLDEKLVRKESRELLAIFE